LYRDTKNIRADIAMCY